MISLGGELSNVRSMCQADPDLPRAARQPLMNTQVLTGAWVCSTQWKAHFGAGQPIKLDASQVSLEDSEAKDQGFSPELATSLPWNAGNVI